MIMTRFCRLRMGALTGTVERVLFPVQLMVAQFIQVCCMSLYAFSHNILVKQLSPSLLYKLSQCMQHILNKPLVKPKYVQV